MRVEKFTTKFAAALSDAQSLAISRDNQFIEPVHMMAALLDQRGGTSRHLLAKAGVNVNQVRSQLGEALDGVPRVEGTGGDVQVSNDLVRLLNVTEKLAQERNDEFIASELFVLAAVEHKGQLGELLRAAGATREALEAAVEAARGGEPVSDPNAEDNRQALERFTIDLTERAEQGKLDPVIGRDEEIRRAIQVLAAPDQEQPGAHRRTRCGQDRHHRGPGPAHRQRRGAGGHAG